MTRAESRRVKKAVLTPPRQQGYKFSNWNAKNMKHHILETCGKLVSIRTVVRVFHREGLKLLRPRPAPAKGNPEKIRKKKGGASLQDLLRSPSILGIRTLAETLVREGLIHPKIEALKTILREQFSRTPEIRAIVFAQFRDSTTILSKVLKDIPGIRPLRFVGQASKGKNDRGISQKEQIRLLAEFKQGSYNVLVATSVAEEGLDISEVDLVVFFEAVPSEIRAIQRRGRTGRKRDGRVVVLVAAKSADEACLFSEKRKEKAMKETILEFSRRT